jgi:hypothetical protein
MNISRIILPGFLFLLTLASGVWLSHSGKPLPVLILTIHKLISLGTLIVTAVTVFQLAKTVDLAPLTITVMVAAGIFFVSLFATGALLSLGRPVPGVFLALHRAAPLLAVAATAGIFFLLARNG